MENNFKIKKAETQVRTAVLAERQAKSNRLPNVSGQIDAGKQFGRTIDPTTNQFINTGFDFNSMSLGAGMNIFTGGQVYHGIKQSRWSRKSAIASAEEEANTLALGLATAYLNILLFEEQLEIARRRMEISENQLANTLKLIEAGNLPLADRYTLDAQIARDEQALIQAQNNLNNGYLILKSELNLEPDYDFKIERPILTIPDDSEIDSYTLSSVYSIAEGNQPGIKATEYLIKSEEAGVSVARGAYWPTISVFGNISSNYSSQFRRPSLTGDLDEVQLPALIDGDAALITLFEPAISYSNVGYIDQLDETFGQGIGVRMNIPIFQNGQTRLGVERQRLKVAEARLLDAQARNELKSAIQESLANVKAGKLGLAAAERSLDASRIAFENTEKRQRLGAATLLELSTAKQNMDIAQNDYILAKYNYIYFIKILEFYLGKPFTLD